MSKLILTEQGSTPTTPSSGKMAIYAKSDGKPYALNDSGVEYDLTTGGGEDLAATLAIGNATNGNDIVVTVGDEIAGEGGVGTAGDVTLRGGTDSSAAVPGGDVVLVPGAGSADGVVLLKNVGETHSVALEVSGDEKLTIGSTFKFEYDGVTGKLTIPGIIDPVAVVFEKSTLPTTTSEQGAIFVSDGSSGLVDGDCYYVPPSSGTPINLSIPTIPVDTLQAAYTAGHSIVLSGAATPVEITAGAAPSASLLAFFKSSGDGLLTLKHSAAERFMFKGADGGASINGTSIDILAGSATGPGNHDGGSITFKPGAKVNSGKDGNLVFFDVSGTKEVDLYVDPTATYPAPVLRSPTSGGGSVGALLGPVVNLLDIYTATNAVADVHTIPNHAAVCLYNNGATAGTRDIKLPANPVAGQTVVVKDVLGTAAAKPTTISATAGLIDGAASVLLNVNWKSYTFVYNQNWFII